MTGTDLELRTQQTLALLDSSEFANRVGPLLPDTVPLRRFIQITKTAIRTKPDLSEADDRSLFNAIIRCAQDGLYPDGREAAINVYNSKVKGPNGDAWVKQAQYLPMIGGLRKNLAEHGWTLKTRCVYSNDDFDYVEEPASIRHTPVRPGADRGHRIGAYAVATHTDGRRLQIFLDETEIAKRRAKAKTDNVWKEWPDQMAEKSAGHAIYDEIPKAERDRMRIPSDTDTEPAAAAELLYGPAGSTFTTTPATPPARADAPQPQEPAEATPSGDAPDADGDGHQQAESAATPHTAADSVPGDDEPEPGSVDELGQTVMPSGTYKGMTFSAVAALDADAGIKWFRWALARPASFDETFYGLLQAYVEKALPDVWAERKQAA